jgi:hypothetical protein
MSQKRTQKPRGREEHRRRARGRKRQRCERPSAPLGLDDENELYNRPDNFCRPLHWRWLRASFLVDDGGPLSPGHDDGPVQEAVPRCATPASPH